MATLRPGHSQGHGARGGAPPPGQEIRPRTGPRRAGRGLAQSPRHPVTPRVPPAQVPCQVLATLLHYFFLSAFAWMLVEGLHLYSMVVKVFGSEGSKRLYYYGIGWGRWAQGRGQGRGKLDGEDGGGTEESATALPEAEAPPHLETPPRPWFGDLLKNGFLLS